MTQWDRDFSQELEKRIRDLEEKPNALPPRFSRRDLALVIAAGLLCLTGLFWGAFL